MLGLTIATDALPSPPAVKVPPEPVNNPSPTARNLTVFAVPDTEPDENPLGVVKESGLPMSLVWIT